MKIYILETEYEYEHDILGQVTGSSTRGIFETKEKAIGYVEKSIEDDKEKYQSIHYFVYETEMGADNESKIVWQKYVKGAIR